MRNHLLIFGAGGHGKVVIDLVERLNTHEIVGLCDDDRSRWGSDFFGHPIIGGRNTPAAEDCEVLIALGSNQLRRKLAAYFRSHKKRLAVAVHPSVQVGRGATFGDGTVVIGGAIVNSDARIGSNVIINTCAAIDHDCVIGDDVHIAPGARLCGGAIVGDGAFVGAGAIIVPGIRIGAGAMVAAGACVISDVPDRERVAGVPARTISKKPFREGSNEICAKTET